MSTLWSKNPLLYLAVIVLAAAVLACDSESPFGTAIAPQRQPAATNDANPATDPESDSQVGQAIQALSCQEDVFLERLAATSSYIDLEASSFQDKTVVFKDGYVNTENEAQKKSLEVSTRLLRDFPCLERLTVIIYLDDQQHVSTLKLDGYEDVLDVSLENIWANVDRLLASLGISDEPLAQEFARENLDWQPAAGGAGPQVTAGDSNINIRSGPGTDYQVIGTLPPGESMAIIGRNSDSSWWQVHTPDGAGWIAAFVTTASNTDQPIPVVDASSLLAQGTPGSTTAVDAVLDETACHPNARITSPAPGAPFSSRVVAITGYANLSDFHHYKIEYSTDPAGGDWTFLFEEEKLVENDVLMLLETSTVPYGPYGVRLTVVDTSGASPAPCIRWFNDSRFVTPEPAGSGAQPKPAADPAGNVPCLCDGDYYDCSSFGSHNSAQACFEYCFNNGQGDIHGLDQNNDGSVCNSG